MRNLNRLRAAAAVLPTRALSSAAAEAHAQRARRTTKSLRSHFGEGRSGRLHELLCRRALAFQNAAKADLFVGFDVSVRCTGIAVVDAGGRGVLCRACETHREVNVIDVGMRLKAELDRVLQEVNAIDGVSSGSSGGGGGGGGDGGSNSDASPARVCDRTWHVGVEECAKTFTRGRFNAKGLVKLAQINGIVQYICADQFGETPLLVHPASARAFYDLNVQVVKEVSEFEVDGGTDGRRSGGGGGSGDGVKDVKERVFDFVQARKTADTWVSESSDKGRLDISDAYLIAWYTRARHIFSALKADDEVWLRFGIEIDNLKPVKARREAECVRERLLWGWMRTHKVFLGL
jgi:hypothetical protein